MKANDGDFVTATVDLPEDHPIRQGILEGGMLYGESGATYKVVEVHAVVRNLWGSTAKFVNNWRTRTANNNTN